MDTDGRSSDDSPSVPPTAVPQAGTGRPKTWLAVGVLGILLLSAFGFLWMRGGGLAAGDRARAPSSNVRTLQQALATAQKNDEVSRAAIRKLQDELAARDAEIATLKEDLTFYERFVGTSAQRQPLGVEDLRIVHREGQIWQFNAVVARSSDAANEIGGRLSFTIEGMQGNGLKKLAWSELRQGAGSDGVAFNLKYFQRLNGDFVLPAGFKPTRITARLVPQQGAAVERTFDWADVAH